MPPAEHNPPMVDRLQAQTKPFVPANTENFLNDVCRPELSLADLAKKYSTTVDALSVWLSRPDVVQRLAEIRSVSAQRAGFIAGMHLPHYANSLADSLAQAVTESKCMSHFTLTIESNTLRVRYRENIRKTVALLANIARFERTATRWAKPKDPKPTSPPPGTLRPAASKNSPCHADPVPQIQPERQRPSVTSPRTNSNASRGTTRARERSRPAASERAAQRRNQRTRRPQKRVSSRAPAASSPRPPASSSVSQSTSRRSRTASIPRPRSASKPARARLRQTNIRQSNQGPANRAGHALPGPAP